MEDFVARARIMPKIIIILEVATSLVDILYNEHYYPNYDQDLINYL